MELQPNLPEAITTRHPVIPTVMAGVTLAPEAHRAPWKVYGSPWASPARGDFLFGYAFIFETFIIGAHHTGS